MFILKDILGPLEKVFLSTNLGRDRGRWIQRGCRPVHEYSDDDPNSPLDSLFHFSHGFSLDRPRKGTADKETFIKGCNLFTFG